MKIKGIDSELFYFPFVVIAPIFAGILFIIGGYLKVGLIILIGNIIPVIMLIKEIIKNRNPK